MFYKIVSKIRDIAFYLEGKKTHIIAAIGAIVNLVNYLSVSGAFNFNIPHLAQINVLLGFLGLSALRAGMKKV